MMDGRRLSRQESGDHLLEHLIGLCRQTGGFVILQDLFIALQDFPQGTSVAREGMRDEEPTVCFLKKTDLSDASNVTFQKLIRREVQLHTSDPNQVRTVAKQLIQLLIRDVLSSIE